MSDMVCAEGFRMALSQEHCAHEKIPSFGPSKALAVGTSSIYGKQIVLFAEILLVDFLKNTGDFPDE